jgi:type I restriction-modification system DNA methylase subunit
MVKESKNGSNLGFESELWRAADALHSNMDAREYKHVVLGLIFLKYISDAFEEQHTRLEADRNQGADPEDDGEPFEEKIARFTTVLREQNEKTKKLDQIIWANLEDIGYGV